MPRDVISMAVPDLSAFARSVARAAAQHHALAGSMPTHQQWLNLLVRAAGQRNQQSLRAAMPAPGVRQPLAIEDVPAAPELTALAKKTLMQFDSRGRLIRWPNKYSVQCLAMWVLWCQFDGRRVYTERQVNEVLKAGHTFGDHATLRRELINHQLMSRKSDCSEYRKLPKRPDDEARTLLAAWRAAKRAYSASNSRR